MSHLLGILQPGSHALAGASPGTYFCQPTGHNPEASHCCEQSQAVHRNKEKRVLGAGFGNPMEALPDEWQTDCKNTSILLGSTWSHNCSIPGNCLITGQSSHAASSFCSVAWWVFISGKIMTSHPLVKWRASLCQFFTWKSQLSCTGGVSLSCLREGRKLMLTWFSCFLDERWALTQLQREQQSPQYIKW